MEIINFFEPMKPPTVTHQEKKVGIRNGKPYFYEPPELQDARGKLMAHLAQHKPAKPFDSAVELTAFWQFPIIGGQKSGEWKTTRPDTDNLNKLLKDVMTVLGYWKDDALVCMETIAKAYSSIPGISIRVRPLGDDVADYMGSEVVTNRL